MQKQTDPDSYTSIKPQEANRHCWCYNDNFVLACVNLVSQEHHLDFPSGMLLVMAAMRPGFVFVEFDFLSLLLCAGHAVDYYSEREKVYLRLIHISCRLWSSHLWMHEPVQ